jgi:hypothetical protein
MRSTSSGKETIPARLPTLTLASYVKDPKAPVALRSQETAHLLSNSQVLRNDEHLRLFALAVKDDLDGEIDSIVAKRDWTEVMRLARELNIPKWIYRAQGKSDLLTIMMATLLPVSGTFPPR